MTETNNTISVTFTPDQRLIRAESKLPPKIPALFQQYLSSQKINQLFRSVQACKLLLQKPGIHSHDVMAAAGFVYIGKGDTARCNQCGLEVSGWTLDMKPFLTHVQRSPQCEFVRAIVPEKIIPLPTPMNVFTTASRTTDDERSTKHQKREEIPNILEPMTLKEVELLKQMRKRTFSHWPHRASPSSSQMIEAGFFNCNVGDRVICLYCNIVCQQWLPNVDDPWEVHRTLSPKCSYVIAALKRQQTASYRIFDEQPLRDGAMGTTATDPFRLNEIVFTAACHPAYIETSRRYASFVKWPKENSPSVSDLVRAGFFYTGTKTIVTCFYCNGSLQNWGANDNPTIEHARWFPHCAYAKQLCGAELYRKIQVSKRAQEKRESGQPNILDKNTLSRFVAARLDLPISQHMLDRNFKLSIIKRCWEDQLRLKHEDFGHVCDLFLACMILQKQIERIDGKKENIIVPNVAIKQIHEKQQAVIREREQAAASASLTNSSNNIDVDMSATNDSSAGDQNVQDSSTRKGEMKDDRTDKAKASGKGQGSDSSTSNLCVLCLEEERKLTFIPCEHLATCFRCGHLLCSCPICRRVINGIVRIYI